MFCENCGNKLSETAVFCGACGTRVAYNTKNDEIPQEAPALTAQEEETVVYEVTTPTVLAPVVNPVVVPPTKSAVDVIKGAFGGVAFLLAILFMSASEVIDIINNSVPNVLRVIAIVAMVILFVKANQRETTSTLATPFKMFGGVLLATEILIWVLVGVYAAIATALLLFVFVIGVDVLPLEELAELDVWYYLTDASMQELLEPEIVETIIITVAAVFILMMVFAILINTLCFGRMRKCTKSLAKSCASNELKISKLGKVKSWLIALGVIGIIGGVSSLGIINGAETLVEQASDFVREVLGKASLAREISDIGDSFSSDIAVLSLVSSICMAASFFSLWATAEKIKVDKSEKNDIM